MAASATNVSTNFNYLSSAGTKRRALCIACSYPGSNLALPGTVPDQDAMVTTLTRNGYDVTYITDADPSKKNSTRANIIAEMEAIVSWANQSSGRQIWVSYSGHGTQTTDYDREEEDGMDEAMVPTDYNTAGLITDDKLKAIFSKLRKESSCMIFMDCCHSGTILDLPYCLSSELSGPLYPPNDNTGTIYCVSAALDEQCAYETAEGGVCTRAFLGSYRPGQTPGQILRNMRAYATKKGMPQTIAMHSNKEFKDGDASFIEAPPSHGNPCTACIDFFMGENQEARSVEKAREVVTGKKPPPTPVGMPKPPQEYIRELRAKNGYVTA